MTTKTMVLLGIIWLGVVVVWLFTGVDFAVGLWTGVRNPTVLRLVFRAAMLVYCFFLVGWVVPLAWGIYRAVKHR
jgi:hypothetical protein